MKRINKKALYIILFSLFIILIISIYSQMNVYENMTTKTIAPKPKSTIDKNSIQKSTLDVIEGKMTKFFFNFNAFKGRIKEFNEKIKFGKSQFNGTNIIQMLVKYQTGYQYTDGTNYKKDASEYKCINGETDGLYQCWYTNGQKEMESYFKNGISHGSYQRWNRSGQKEKECYYSNGKQNKYIPIFKTIKKNVTSIYL
jgi:antitoxin component YwqK of YwqJK toxin-antitoxin module